MSNKIKVLTISDHPLSPSGVGTQTKYVCEALLNSGKFEILSLGGAIKHNDYRPITVGEWGEEWRIIPIDGYGNHEIIRSIIRNEKPDIVWIMTDPRFWEWLWAIENEIRALCPIVYYHVWDNYPYPMYNRPYYLSNDYVVSISKLTDDIVRNVAPEVNCAYIPHAVDQKHFAPVIDKIRDDFRKKTLSEADRDKFIIFWNNRNARRKQSGTVLWWYKEWLDENDLSGKVLFIMHTDPHDGHGQDLVHIANQLEMPSGEVLFSRDKVPLENMGAFYSIADVTVNISDAEGFGLATLESLACGTPIIVTVTGGLQEQVMSNGELFGVPLFPASKAIIGSQQVPYIYEDRICKKDFFAALSKIYNMTNEERRALGMKGANHVNENYNFKKFGDSWVKHMLDVYETQGSWSTRRDYTSITFKEIA
jgi:glycosyltransferase involved in cell wall biosynthesis|tara:strand:- start:33117 stop:34382 length:1266 start_codon:yes stop_codon:yes gene_type:complete